ncbi:hypothetical protein J5X98_10355 [Leptothermofonsia sichuanensis E412]|uniref:hypothetical protein n=1 Tax=Leptothermofonsia sichuanensis TaxID=2917832 RepID=UPI001CA6EAA0|nr:hypothetical protein [Leptothermofonsia sichuanensis]QZZ22719.1 hypothetical protein J5X98_10355 [Leptothermofonsia sichuanensis E412]
MMKLYHTELSENCHKVRLMLSLLGLGCDHPTIADISCYPHVLAWIERIKQLPGYEGMSGL